MDVVEAFRILGLNRLEATVLAYLLEKKEAYVMDIERETGLRQPEVSLALRGLKKFNAVEVREEERKVKKIGRARKIAKLKDIKEIAELFRRNKEKVDEAYRVADSYLVARVLENEVDSDNCQENRVVQGVCQSR